MKTLGALLLVVLPVTGMAQVFDRTATAADMPKFTNAADFPVPMTLEPFKKANVVYILTKDSTADAFRNVGRLLLSAGYTFASTDKDFWNISTNPKGAQSTGAYTISATVDTKSGWRVIALRGQMSMVANEILVHNGSQIKSDIEYGGMKGSILMNGWLELDKIAKAYPGAKVGYWNL